MRGVAIFSSGGRLLAQGSGFPDRALSAAFLSQAVFDDIEAEFGAFELSELAAFLYVLVALPE